METAGHSKTLVTNYQPRLHNIPEKQRPQHHCSRSLKSGKEFRIKKKLFSCSRVLYRIIFKIMDITKLSFCSDETSDSYIFALKPCSYYEL
jgi:hypothetical protein